MLVQVAAFRAIMRRRFLDGEEHAHIDYGLIDGDATLDDFWACEAAQDAQDAYFDAD